MKKKDRRKLTVYVNTSDYALIEMLKDENESVNLFLSRLITSSINSMFDEILDRYYNR